MTWSNDDGTHEGWTAAIAPDGRHSIGSTGGGQLFKGVTGNYPLETYSHDIEIVPDREIIGWQGRCECGWQGQRWARVSLADQENAAARKIFVPADEFADAPSRVEDAVWDEWKAHLRPVQAREAVREAVRASAAAGRALTAAVAAARDANVSWADIGQAAGISRQAAHERWGGGRP